MKNWRARRVGPRCYFYTKWTPIKFTPALFGVSVRVGKCHRAELVGGSIYRGRLVICDYRMPKLFDLKRSFRKTLGNRVEIMKRNMGWYRP